MTDLIRRLEEAKEGSRELSLLVDMRLNPDKWFGTFESVVNSYDWITFTCNPTHYTTSLDAVQDALLPGFQLRLEPRFDADGEKVNWRAYAIKPHWERYNPVHDDWFTVHEGRHSNEYIAACIAILRAMEAKNE